MDGTKLAGPAGGYDGGQKMSTQKRKRDKAQEQLRTRMRQRINGSGSSSTLLHPRRHSSLHDGSRDTSLSPNVNHSSTETRQNGIQPNNYWRSQQDRYTALSQIQSGRSPRISKNQTVPLQELVDRVLHRKEQNFGLGSKTSPMTIRAYKPPVAPYAIQQQSVIKKMVVMQPIQRRKPEDKGPFVLVLQRNESGETKSETRGKRRSKSQASVESDGAGAGSFPSSPRDLPPVKASKTAAQSEVELKTWRPALDKVHQPAVLPEAEDRSVTNYRLQLQQANKLAESRFEFHHPVPSTQTVEEITMQSLNPLPPIQTMYQDESMDNETSDKVTSSMPDGEAVGNTAVEHDEMSSQEQQTDKVSKPVVLGAERTTSKTDIINMKKARREAKHQKKPGEELTLLRTRKRFTNKTKQFKNDLQRARQLSAIQEDRSSLGSGHLSRLSAERSSVSSSSNMSSLKQIDETMVSNGSMTSEIPAVVEADQSNSGDVKDIPSSSSMQTISQMPHAHPSTPAANGNQEGNDVISRDDSTERKSEDSASSDEDSTMDEGEPEGEPVIGDGDLPSSGEDDLKETTQPVIIQGDDIIDGMMWVEGEIPLRENSLTHQEPTAEHGR